MTTIIACRRAVLGLLLGLILVGCSERVTPDASTLPDTTTPTEAGSPSFSDAGIEDAAVRPDSSVDDGGAQAPGQDALYQLHSLDDFARLAAVGNEVKYLLDAAPSLADAGGDDAAASLPGPCVFQDTRKYPYHLQFLRSLAGYETLSAERYEERVLWRATRTMYAGVLKMFSATPHPASGKLGVLAFTLYAAGSAEEQLTAAELIDVHQRLSDCAGTLSQYLVYLPQTPAELQAAQRHASELDAAGVVVMNPSDLRPSLEAEIYTVGEAYGFLRYIEGEAAVDTVGPRDVVMTDAAPSDLGLVAALVTRHPQSGVSHLNLRLREKNIPSASAPRLFDAALLAQLADKLVHLRAEGDSVIIEPARAADAEAHWEKTRPALDAPTADLSATELLPLATLEHEDADKYGTKAANLGEIIRALPERNTVRGLAIPFAAYAEHIQQHELDARVTALATSNPWQSDTISSSLETLRDAIRKAPVLPEWEEALLAGVSQLWGEAGLRTRLRFRSSTNVEDLPGISGAGLYDSASGCLADDLDADDIGPSLCLSDEQRTYYESELELRREELAAHPERQHLHDLIEDLEDELTKEKSARRALRKVWASLWNRRAFDDRHYYGIDHRQVYMAVAVHPAFVGEQLEAVVVTNLEPDSDTQYYRVASQRGEVGIVRPSDPNAVAEHLGFRRGTDDTVVDVTLINPSSLSAGGKSLWSESLLEELATQVFVLHDVFAQHVYPEISPLKLDVEVDVTHDGKVVFKQARPY